MTPERYARMKAMLLAVADLPEPARSAYLDDACGGDPDLRREVEANLAFDQSTNPGRRLDPPVGATLTEPTTVGRLSGETVSHFRVQELIGAGGMGEVYRATDLRLQRTVALKFLRREAVGSGESRARFIREARAAAALDHPNICAIHDIEEWEGNLFLVMACVEGRTLKARMTEGPLPVPEALDIAGQIALGLAEAHARGLMHRDVKPANVMVRKDGLVQILDFGLARSTAEREITRTGAVMGTIAYMSPEQARAEPVDHRTDIWSLGVVLYEMIAGRLPFRGEHEASLLYAILHADPEPIAASRSDCPAAVEPLVRRALARDPGARYQSAADFRRDIETVLHGGTPPGIDRVLPAAPARRPRSRWFRRVRARFLLTRVAPVAAVLIALAVAMRFIPRERPPAMVIPDRSLQVTSGDGMDREPAISPEGGRIAYVAHTGENADIYLVDAHGDTPLRLTDDPAPDDRPAWFPDGSAIAFSSQRGGEWSVWKVGQMGGGATLLVPDAMDPAISPDGSRIAFARTDENGNLRIMVAPIAMYGRASRLTGDKDGLWHHGQPAWSPDGKSICYAAMDGLWIVPSHGGAVRRVTQHGLGDVEPCWSADGKRIYFSSSREGTTALWQVAARGGWPSRLTLGGGHETHPSVSPGGHRLAYSTSSGSHHLVLRDLGRDGGETVLSDLHHTSMIAMAPDASALAFISARSGPTNDLWLQPLKTVGSALWRRNILAGPPRRLTELATRSIGLGSFDPLEAVSNPVFSADGTRIAYYLISGGQRDIWAIDARGGAPARLTDDPGQDYQPTWAPDRSAIAWISDRDGRARLWREPVTDRGPAGLPRRLTGTEVVPYAPSWSPNGREIAFVGRAGGLNEVWVIPADGSRPARPITHGANAQRVRWDGVTGDVLASGSWDGDHFVVRRVLLDGTPPRDFTPPLDLGDEQVFALFDVSADGRLAVFSREEHIAGSIWLLESNSGGY